MGNWNQVVQAVSTLGFPIITCFGLAWYVKDQSEKNHEYVKDQTEKNREQVNKMQEIHREEMKEITTAINNNTLALNKLAERMEN